MYVSVPVGGIPAAGNLGGVQSSELRAHSQRRERISVSHTWWASSKLFKTQGDETSEEITFGGFYWRTIRSPLHRRRTEDLFLYYCRTVRDGTVFSTHVFAFAVFDSYTERPCCRSGKRNLLYISLCNDYLSKKIKWVKWPNKMYCWRKSFTLTNPYFGNIYISEGS